MIRVELYWVTNGEKHPFQDDKTVNNHKELEKYRKELAHKHNCNVADVMFKYSELRWN